MKYTKALFIYNGNAGKDEIGKLLEISLPKLAESMEQLLVFKSIRPGHAKALCEQYGEEVELVIVLGGDVIIVKFKILKKRVNTKTSKRK